MMCSAEQRIPLDIVIKPGNFVLAMQFIQIGDSFDQHGSQQPYIFPTGTNTVTPRSNHKPQQKLTIEQVIVNLQNVFITV